MSTQKREKNYSLTYDGMSSLVVKINSLLAVSLLFKMIESSSVSSNNVCYRKNSELAVCMDTSRQTISRLIRILVKSKSIKKVENGFMVNPDISWKGRSENINIGYARWNKL